MATADQIKALVKSFVDKDDNRFFTTALQVADKEERLGHRNVADEIRKLVRERDISHLSTKRNAKFTSLKRPLGIVSSETGIEELLYLTPTTARFSDLVLSEECKKHVERALVEYKQKDQLAKFGLLPKRKLLLTGPPGTGKTMTAKVLATELRLPLYALQFDGLISRYLGETAAKLRMVFNHINSSRAVYLFDEFDAIGAKRSNSNDVGEIRRVLNSFLQFFEEDSSESLIICATNHPELLDPALFRRFDDTIDFSYPGVSEAEKFIKSRLFLFETKNINFKKVSETVKNLSYAELGQACDDCARDSVLNHKGKLTQTRLINSIKYRVKK